MRGYELTDEQWDKIKHNFEIKNKKGFGVIYPLITVNGMPSTNVSVNGRYKEFLRRYSRNWHLIVICKIFR